MEKVYLSGMKIKNMKVNINNNKKKNKIKSTLNKSYDVLSSINNIDTSSSYHNNYEVNYTYCDIKQVKNPQKRNSGNKLKYIKKRIQMN